MKIGIDYIPPVFFGALRMFIGAGFMFGVVWMSGGLKHFRTRQRYSEVTRDTKELQPKRREFETSRTSSQRRPHMRQDQSGVFPTRADWPMVMSVGLLQMAIPTALMHFSLSFVDAGRASLLAFTHPIWVAPLAILFLSEKLNKATVAGLCVGMAGLGVLFNPFGFDWRNTDVLLGNGLLILSAISWAVGIVHVRAHNWNASPLSLSPWQMLVSGSLLLALSLAREDISSTIWDINLVYVLSFVGIAATGFAYWGAVTVSRQLPAMVSSLGFLGVPVVGIGSSAIILMEPFTLTLAMGTGLILLGLAIMTVFGDASDE